ncbi:MAG: ABC transporter permease [Pirellulales bacterium]
MKKLLGLIVVLVILYGITIANTLPEQIGNTNANLARNIGQHGIICLGVAAVIITGGIDLSIGSFMGLCATVLAMGLSKYSWSPPVAIAAVLGLGVVVGTIHGLLVTKAKLQPFVVTLCGLFIYRGLARWWGNDTNSGLKLGFTEFRTVFANYTILGLPVAFWYLVGVVVVATIVLHRSVYGRYLFAIGSNELAARYSGIRVDLYKILAYVICSVSTAFFAVLYLAEIASAQPSSDGQMLELYAIAGAVIGGCSLRGGEGTVAGIVVGTAILFVMKTAVFMVGVPDRLLYTAIGLMLLAGAMIDEFSRRRNTAVRK